MTLGAGDQSRSGTNNLGSEGLNSGGSINGGSGSEEQRMNTGNLQMKIKPGEIILLEKDKGKAESK